MVIEAVGKTRISARGEEFLTESLLGGGGKREEGGKIVGQIQRERERERERDWRHKDSTRGRADQAKNCVREKTECLTIGVRSRREREDQRKKEFKGASFKQKYSGLHLNDFLVTSLIKVYPFQSM